MMRHTIINPVRRIQDRQRALANAARLVRHQDLIILDTETTGTESNDEIVEIAAVNLAGELEFETLLRPSRAIPEKVIAIHGITNEMIAGMPTFAEIGDTLVSMLGLTPIRAIATYNAEFDRRLLLQTSLIWQRPNQIGTHFTEWHCIMQIYSAYFGEWSSYFGNYKFQSLDKAVARLGVPIPEGLPLHRARTDALCALGVLKALAAIAKQEGIDAQ